MHNLTSICPGNAALAFLAHRIADPDYRGAWSSQHNRYDFAQIRCILTLFDQHAPDGTLMCIRDTDIAKRPQNTPDEHIYAQFCTDAKHQAGIGTQDAMRKNLFVDLHRMGLIHRYDVNQNPIHPMQRAHIKHAALAPQGQKLIRANMQDAYFIFSKGIDQLLGGFIATLLALLDEEHDLRKITLHEFMFFASAVGAPTAFSLDVQKCAHLIRQHRTLSRLQREAVIDLLTTELQPDRYAGDKRAKRDFHNWKNKAQQVFHLLAQTVYFHTREGTLHPAAPQDGANTAARLVRSQSEKLAYFARHNIPKRKGFELHHVVPLAWSENRHQFKLLDNWQNMVYIDGYNHAYITQNANKNVIMSAQADDIILNDYSDPTQAVHLKHDEHILYNPTHQQSMLQYNAQMLENTPQTA